MATYRLQSLLRIRANREDKASAALAVARQAVAEALNAVHTRERELADFRATAEARRDRIYATAPGRASRASMTRVSCAPTMSCWPKRRLTSGAARNRKPAPNSSWPRRTA